MFLIRRPGHARYFILNRAVKTFQAVAFDKGDHVVFQIVQVLFHRFAEYIIARSRQARAFLLTCSAHSGHAAEVHHQWQGQRSFSARTIFAICELECSTVSFSNLTAENQTDAAAAVLGGKKRDKEVVTVEK